MSKQSGGDSRAFYNKKWGYYGFKGPYKGCSCCDIWINFGQQLRRRMTRRASKNETRIHINRESLEYMFWWEYLDDEDY